MDPWELQEPVDILSKLPDKFVENVESTKWQERRDALQALLALCPDNTRLCPKASYGEYVSIFKKILEKDANINVCALAARCITAFAKGLRKKFGPHALAVTSVIFEKFKEKRPLLRDPLCECIDAVVASTTLEAIGEDVQAALEKPNPNIKLQVNLFLYREFTKLNAQTVPKKVLKTLAPLIIKHTGDSDPEVREASYAALGAVMKAIGEKACMVLLAEIAEDKTKMTKILAARDRSSKEAAEAEAQLRQAQADSMPDGPIANGASANEVVSRTNVDAAPVEIDTWDMLEPVDVLSKLPSSFTELVESKKWIERRDALQMLLTLCTDNPRLCPKANYGEHVAILKKILEKDANINVCAVAARCLTGLALGLRKKFAPYVSSVAPLIFEKFKEKRPLLRDPLSDCIDAVAASTTLEAMGEEVQVALEKANPNIKIQTNLFLYRSFMKYNAQTAPKKLLKAFVPIIIKHSGDSDPEVREASYSALGAAMKAIGEKACMVLLGPIVEDKTKMTKIRDFRDKAAKEAGADVVSAMVQSIHKSDHGEAGAGDRVNELKNEAPLKPPTSSMENKKVSKGKIQEAEDQSTQKFPAKEISDANSEDSVKVKESALVTNREKATRLKDEKNFKVLKWNFDQPTSEHVEQLHSQFTSVAIPSLCSMLFSKDFKQHLKALDLLDSLVLEDPDAIVTNSDLILKWISLRFFETNQQVLLKALDLASKVFTAIQSESEPFTDTELTSFVPYLISKLGETKDSIRGPVRKIIFLLTEIASPPRIFPFIVDGLGIKNSRLRAECLQILLAIIDSNGLSGTSTPGPSLKAIAACISDRDSNVRSAALNAIVAAFKEAGDVVFQLIGKLNDKDQAMLEERIKRSGAVPKIKGSPASTSSAQGRKGRPVIGSAIKGGKATPQRRSVSRNSNKGYNPSAEEESSDDRSLTEEDTRNRTFTAVQDSTTAGTRPRFSLNLKALGIETSAPPCPQFCDDEEMSSLLNQIDAPVRRRTQNPLPPRRTESIGSITSLDSYAGGDIDKTVHGIASISPAAAMQALSQLQYLFQEPNLFRFLLDRIDGVVQAVVTQTSLIRSRHLNEFALLDEVNDLIRLINNFLCSMVREHTTCKRITTENLKMLIQEFLYLLKDERIKRLKGASEIVRSLNYLTIRICDNADPTFCYLALVSMLGSALRDPQNDTVVLITKCVIKQSDQFLRDNFARETPMDMDAVMLATHEFMSEFRPRADESSIFKEANQCVELSIQRLTMAYGASMLNYFSRISDPENSEAMNYTRRCVRSWQKSRGGLTSSIIGNLPGQVVGASGDSLRQLVNGVVQEPFGDGFKNLLSCVKALPNVREPIDEMLKENVQHREFFRYHLKKAMDSDRELPNLLPETIKATEFISSMESSLKTFLQTGVWNEAPNKISDSRPEKSGSPQIAKRVGSLVNAVSGDDIPESEDSLNGVRNGNGGTHKKTLTASDVEPLRQLLNRRRGMRD